MLINKIYNENNYNFEKQKKWFNTTLIFIFFTIMLPFVASLCNLYVMQISNPKLLLENYNILKSLTFLTIFTISLLFSGFALISRSTTTKSISTFIVALGMLEIFTLLFYSSINKMELVKLNILFCGSIFLFTIFFVAAVFTSLKKSKSNL